jgi:tetratricopeptide (TPR) repeat protein
VKPLPIIATALALAVTGSGIYFYQKRSSRTATQVKKLQDQPSARKPVPWRDIANPVPAMTIATPSATTSPAPGEPAPATPPPAADPAPAEPESPDLSGLSMAELCAADWQQAAGIELSLLRHQVAQGDFAMTTDCARMMFDANQSGDLGWFIAQCQPAAEIQMENRDRCVSLAMIYRAYAIGKVVRDQEKLADVETSTLANILTRNMTSLKSADAAQLDQSVAIANEIIRREPDAYGAYKAKAVAMILKEVRFKAEMDEDDFAQTMAEMASFESYDPAFSLREEILGDSTDMTTASSRDPDIARLPFLRQMALGDYEVLMAEAEDYIDEFPDSPTGYQFLAQGLWRTGEKAEALQALRRGMDQDADNSLLLDLFEKVAERPAVDYLSEIRMEIDPDHPL